MSPDSTIWRGSDVPGPQENGAEPVTEPPSFRWGAMATLGWTVAIGVVTVIGVAVVAFGLVAVGYLMVPVLPDTPAGDDLVGTLITETLSRHLTVLTVAQGVVSTAMVLLLTIPKGDLTRARMLALEPIGFRRLAFWVVAILLAIIVLTELPLWMAGVHNQHAMDWLRELKPLWLALLLVVVIAPVSEEIVFRGFIYGGLAPSRMGPVGAIFFTSLVWAAMHVQYPWPLIVQIFVYGVIFGVARWRSGSLWPPLVAHGLINLYATVTTFWFSGTTAT